MLSASAKKESLKVHLLSSEGHRVFCTLTETQWVQCPSFSPEDTPHAHFCPSYCKLSSYQKYLKWVICIILMLLFPIFEVQSAVWPLLNYLAVDVHDAKSLHGSQKPRKKTLSGLFLIVTDKKKVKTDAQVIHKTNTIKYKHE